MTEFELGPEKRASKYETLSKEDLIKRSVLLEFELRELVKENYKLRNQSVTDSQASLLLEEQLKELRGKVFGSSSERYKKPLKEKEEKKPEDPKPRVKLPSERYPNAPLREERIEIDPPPACSCCGNVMSDSGMTEDSEQLTVIPKKFEIVRQKRVKYRCSCQSAITTAPSPPRIIEGSSYSDEMILDVALSKYCDLIPIQRYSAMASRSGLMDLPPHSLIELTHQFADFVSPVYTLIKKAILASRVLHADETPHRMLEGSEKKQWYLWGFSTSEYCFLECRDTRSGNVASEILVKSKCEKLISDVFSGYAKAVREANVLRAKEGLPLIKSGYCNAHGRRYFFKSWPRYPEAQFYLDHFHEIYRLDAQSKGQPPPLILEYRAQMRVRFEAMKERATLDLAKYPSKGIFGKALSYFLGNYNGLTLFLSDPEMSIDNNSQERLLRDHVVGRKTWYGTHSKRGALTAAILFSLVETCKLNQVNPREYFKQLVADLHAGKSPYTPLQFKTQK